MTSPAKMKLVFEVVEGVEGPCLTLGDGRSWSTRIAGPKPWGGGQVICRWRVDPESFLETLFDLISDTGERERR